MNEKFKAEINPVPENIGDQKYHEMQEAKHEENRIMRIIEEVFSTKSREEAEKIVSEHWIPLLEETRKKSDEILKEWRDSIKNPDPKERLNNIEK